MELQLSGKGARFKQRAWRRNLHSLATVALVLTLAVTTAIFMQLSLPTLAEGEVVTVMLSRLGVPSPFSATVRPWRADLPNPLFGLKNKPQNGGVCF